MCKENLEKDNFKDENLESKESEFDNCPDDSTKEESTQADDLSGEIESLKGQLIRLQADFNNFKKRSMKRESESVGLGVAKLAETLFPVIDNFDIALSHIDDENIFNGVKMIYDQLIEALKSENIEMMNTDKEQFDPNLHYAVMMEEKEGYKSGEITETLKKGFMFGDKVIRPAMVKVSK